jgi:hypothetical protein
MAVNVDGRARKLEVLTLSCNVLFNFLWSASMLDIVTLYSLLLILQSLPDTSELADLDLPMTPCLAFQGTIGLSLTFLQIC